MLRVAGRFVVAGMMGLALAACGGQGSGDGRAEVVAVLDALACTDVVRVEVTVTAPDISPDIVAGLTAVGCDWSGTIGGIPVGAGRTFTARAYDASDALVYQGQATGVAIVGGTPALVAIVLQQVVPPPPFDNAAPIIDAVVASAASLEPGDTLTIEVQAHDPDAGDVLTYAWTASGGGFSAAAAAVTDWTAPGTEGTETLTITVTDSKDAWTSVSVDIDVAWVYGSANVTATLNLWPEIQGLVPSSSLVGGGGATTLDLTASDPDGDPLAFAWTSGCGGTFDDATAEDPVWTAPALLEAEGPCTLSVDVLDGRGGLTEGHITIRLGLPPTLQVP